MVEEYKGSMISFVLGEFNWTVIPIYNFNLNYLKKQLWHFLSGTIPIVYGDVGLVKSLEDMGFHLWNDYFGFNEDFLQQSDEIKKENL